MPDLSKFNLYAFCTFEQRWKLKEIWIRHLKKSVYAFCKKEK